jgi:ABC-2 type transport system ATP-binding protein
MKDLILRLKEQGKTVLMCSHLLADVQDVCDRIAILHQGELKELGTSRQPALGAGCDSVSRKGFSPEAEEEIRSVIVRSWRRASWEWRIPRPRSEELFLGIVKDSEARPGRRAQERT